MNLRYERSQPLLSTTPTIRQRAISVATQLMTELNKGGHYRIPNAYFLTDVQRQEYAQKYGGEAMSSREYQAQ